MKSEYVSAVASVITGWSRLAGLILFVAAQSAPAQAPPAVSDARLEAEVTYSSKQASVQDIIQNLVEQTGLRYDWQNSFKQTDPLCRNWVRDVAIKDKTCREALEQILKPVGLRYEIQNGTISLSRGPVASRLAPPATEAQPQPPAKGYVTTGGFPKNLAPAQNLSPGQQRENFEFLCKAIDETYACFELKGLDWEKICQRYRAQLNPALKTDEFYRLLFRLVNELKDTHSWLQNYHLAGLAAAPVLSVDLFDDKPFVIAVSAGSKPAKLGVKPGSQVLEVDGVAANDRISRLRSLLPACSTERAFRREASRRLLAGEPGSSVTLKARSPEGNEQSFVLERADIWRNPPPPGSGPRTLTKGRFVHFGRDPSGLGYIRITSFEGRDGLAEEFDQALDQLRSVPGLILDIRDNPGGFGAQKIVGRFLTKPTLCATSYRKSGPRHTDLKRDGDLLSPTGSWQYTAPVALLVNDVTGSAADLFACYLRSAQRVMTIGSPTHGNLSGVAAYAVLPCGLIARISNGYVCEASGKPIEGVGNLPDITVTPCISDVLAGKDPVLEKAVSVLTEKVRRDGGS